MHRCEECGYEGDLVPFNQTISLVAGFPGVVARLFEGVSAEELRRRPQPMVWSPLEYAAHTGEAIGWYHQRIDRVLTEQRARLWPYDWDTACERGRYRERPTGTVLDDVERRCAGLVGRTQPLGPTEWDRCGVGSDGSPRSVAVLARRAAHEVVHHARDIRHGLAADNGDDRRS